MIGQQLSEGVLVDAVSEIFETMVFMDLDGITHKRSLISEDCILGVVTFNGSVEGCLSVSTSPAGAEAIALNMLGMSPGESLASEEVEDAMGEIANMVMGSMKALTSDLLGEIHLSIPTIVKGGHIEQHLGHTAQELFMNSTLAGTHRLNISFCWRPG